LTGLPNRALFNDRLEHGIAQAKRHSGILAVMFVDLDKFKSINDTYGHDVGDIVLQTVAQRLKEHLRDEDTVSRHGGDEFLCVLTEVQNESNIAMIADKIIKGMRAPCYVNVRDVKVNVNIGASIGIAIFPQHGSTTEMLVKCADEAMYRAKRSNSKYLFAH
jgi:diguanylate cyclase